MHRTYDEGEREDFVSEGGFHGDLMMGIIIIIHQFEVFCPLALSGLSVGFTGRYTHSCAHFQANIYQLFAVLRCVEPGIPNLSSFSSSWFSSAGTQVFHQADGLLTSHAVHQTKPNHGDDLLTLPNTMSLRYMPALPSYPLPFYTTTTTTVRTTTSATIGEVLHLTIPSPLTSVPTSYTTPPRPASPASKVYPYGLPILILTELAAVVYDPSGKEVVSTVTTMQTAPDATRAAGDARNANQEEYFLRNAWGDWTRTERAGVIAGVVGGLTLGMLLWCCCRSRAWGRKGERKKRRSIRGRDGWRGRPKNGGGAEEDDARQKDVELESDPGGRAAEEKDGAMTPRRAEGLPEISISRGSPHAVQETLKEAPSDRGREFTGKPYQMSGALQIPRSPTPAQLRSPVSAIPDRPGEFRDIQLSREASGARISAYRAMRAQERRDERAKA